MQATQRQILQLISISESGISDHQIHEKIGKGLQEIRFHLDELYTGGFIKLITSKAFDEDESYLATSITPRGRMVLKGQISLEDRVDSKSDSQTFNVTNNSPIGSQQLGNKNTASVTQNIGFDTTEVFHILESLKQAVETLPSNHQDVATESITLIEEEINAPKNPSIIKTALFALWSVTKESVTFINAITALAERFNIHLPG